MTISHASRLRLLPALALVVLVAGVGAVAAAEVPPAAHPEEDTPTSSINGRFLLMNHFGEVVTDQDYWGKFLLITFGYTFCPDICPTTLVHMAQALKLLDGEEAARIQALFVSVDPERDTARVLREYVAYFHPDLIGLTGTPELVQRAAANFNVRYEKVVDPGRDPRLYAVDHSAGIYLMSPEGQFIVKFAHALPPEELAARIRTFLSARSGQT